MTTILALDTSTENCSVAISHNDACYSESEVCPREHSQKLLPMVDRLLAATALSLSQVDAIAFGQGPGSFTGVRISVSMMQGLALGADLPVIGISTLASLAQLADQKTKAVSVVSAIDARMGEVYLGCYAIENGLPILNQPEVVVAPESTSSYYPDTQSVGVGTGWQSYYEELASNNIQVLDDILYPDAESMLPLALHKFEKGECLSVEQAQPVYLRDTVTWKKLPGR